LPNRQLFSDGFALATRASMVVNRAGSHERLDAVLAKYAILLA
jgi:hypothetical protein